ncbi:MAG: hypothetical protein SF029_25845 [bacterium]|nr:hypothetical protein [bacterium]
MHSILLWTLLVAGIIAYNLPWASGKGAALTYGAYDLAEWVSLHPAVRADSLLLGSLLLRLPALVLAWIAALSARRFFSFQLLFVLLTAMTLLPPLDFITQRGDVNYRQQFFIALATVIGGFIGLSGVFGRVQWVAAILVALGGVGVSIAGSWRALELLNGFALPVQLGSGSVLMIGVFLLLGLSFMLARKEGQHNAPSPYHRVEKAAST